MALKLLRWIFFTIFLSLVPIISSYISGTANSAAGITISSVLNQGDLFLLCSGFCAAGLGELVGLSRNRLQGLKVVVAGTAILHLVLCIFLYVAIRNPTPTTNIEYLVSFSIFLFVTGSVVATVCVVLSEMQDA